MATLVVNCKICGKPAKIQNEFISRGMHYYTYQCGHLDIRPILTDENEVKEAQPEVKQSPLTTAGEILTEDLENEIQRMLNEGDQLYPPIEPKFDKSFWAVQDCEPFYCKECKEIHNRKHAYEYQREGVFFGEKALTSHGGVLFADAMGLGKTAEGLCLLKRHVKQLLPCIVFVKGAYMPSWMEKIHEWIGDRFTDVMPVTDRIHLNPGFKIYLVSMDLITKKDVQDRIINRIKPKSVIIDECQNFKDRSASRTKAMQRIISEANIEFKIAMSGTPIKNRLTEYYTMLNLLDPRNFYEYTKFCRRWLLVNDKGYYTSLNPYMLDRWKETTGKYIIRREKHEVQKDLPALTRDYQYVEIEDPLVKKSYNAEVDLLKNFLNSGERIDATSLLGFLAKMRAITGAAKVNNAVDWAQDFLDSCEENLAIGIHHKTVRDVLHYVFTKRGKNPLKLSGEDDVFAKNRIVNQFQLGANPLLIINMLAGGQGLDGLQSACSNTLVLELPWNPADMEQFICRFHRDGQKKPVTATYLLAKGTIDEFMFKLIYEKSVISSEAGITIAPHSEAVEDVTKDPQFLREFAEFVSNNKI